MENRGLKLENVELVERFANELSEELGVNYVCYEPEFERSYLFNKRERVDRFISPIFEFNTLKYQLSFIPHSNNTIELWKINVNYRGEGLGTDLMNKILDVADRIGVKIKLVPVGYDEDENTPKNYLEKLKNWYYELGFDRPQYSLIDPYYTYNPQTVEYKMVG